MHAAVTQRDLELLATLAEHRVVTARMVATVLNRNVRALRRRVVSLMHLGFIVAERRYQSAARGRPERFLTLTAEGAELLKARALLDPRTENQRAMRPADAHLKHQAMMSEFRTQLAQIPRIQPEVSLRFLSSTSPFLPMWGNGRPIVYDRFRGRDGYEFSVVPDGVLGLSHEVLRKTLLLFVEVDTGSEPIESPRGHRGSLWHKVTTYQAYYACDAYKRYEKIWDCQLKRFRVLLLAATRTRAAAISRLLRDVGDSDFILVADRERMLTTGVWAAIWRPGGRLDEPEVSILGSQLPHPYPKPASAGFTT